MIAKKSLNSEWISQVAEKHKNADKILIEKVIRALSLLEQLQLKEIEFIFKGGTALILLFDSPKRFSIDIDIILPAKLSNLEVVFEQIIEDSDFNNFEENIRKVDTHLQKQHFKFFYTPLAQTRGSSEYILLDIVYGDTVYGNNLQKQKITSAFILNEGKPTTITIPTIEGLLGDKLTAFAPMTTGILYNKGKEIEIIKQLYDVANLFDRASDLKAVKNVFIRTGKKELENRGLDKLDIEDILQDTYNTALLISVRGKAAKGNYKELEKGIKNIKNYIFSESFHIEKAINCASKVAYLATLLMKNLKEINYYSPDIDMNDWIIQQPMNTKLNKLKKTDIEAFFYWYQIYQLLK